MFSTIFQGKSIRNDQEQSPFGTFENSVNFYGKKRNEEFSRDLCGFSNS